MFHCVISCLPSQLKRNKDKLRSYMVEAGVLREEGKKEPPPIAMTQLQDLASRWGLPQRDPDFGKKYSSERTLAQVLAEHTAVIDLERDTALVRFTSLRV